MHGPEANVARVLVLAATIVAAGCNEAGGSAGLEAVTDTVDGVIRYTYPAEGGALLPWTLDTTALVGEAFSDEDVYQFDRVPAVGGVAGDADGNLFVLDVSGGRVLSFDAEGRHRMTYGRRGSGPGELAQPFGLGVGVGDTIWVIDPLNSRFTGFPDDGGDPRVVTMSGNRGFPSPGFAVRPSGFLVQGSPPIRMPGGGEFRVGMTARIGGGGRAAAPPPPPATDAEDEEDEEKSEDDNFIPIQRISFDGNASTIWRSVPPESNITQMGGSGSGPRMLVMAMAPAFAPTLRWGAFRDGGLVVSDKGSYELTLVAPDGTRRGVITRPMAPWPVTETEKEHAREQVRGRRIAVSGINVDMSEFIEQQIQNMTFAETVPRIAGLAVDPQDRIWVGVALTTPGEVERVDLYSRDGEFLGSLDTIEIPSAFFPDGRAASLFRDPDTDIQRVAVYRFVEGTPR